MRLGVIGNSHVAALKGGLVAFESGFPSLQASFFASRGQSMGRLEAAEGCMVPSTQRLADNLAFTSGGHSRINPADFDAFVLCGLGLGLCYELLGDRHHSRQFVREFTWARWRASLCTQVHDLLRGLTDKPILICPEPFLSESAGRWSRLARSSATPTQHLAAAFSDFPTLWAGDSHLMRQPSESIVLHAFTAARFSAGSVKLATSDENFEAAHGTGDTSHMNAEFGVLVWKEIGRHA